MGYEHRTSQESGKRRGLRCGSWGRHLPISHGAWWASHLTPVDLIFLTCKVTGLDRWPLGSLTDLGENAQSAVWFLQNDQWNSCWPLYDYVSFSQDVRVKDSRGVTVAETGHKEQPTAHRSVFTYSPVLHSHPWPLLLPDTRAQEKERILFTPASGSIPFQCSIYRCYRCRKQWLIRQIGK